MENKNQPIIKQENSKRYGVHFQAALVSLVCGVTSVTILAIFGHRTDIPRGIQPSLLSMLASFISLIGFYPLFERRKERRPILTAILALLGLLCGAIGSLAYM